MYLKSKTTKTTIKMTAKRIHHPCLSAALREGRKLLRHYSPEITDEAVWQACNISRRKFYEV